MKKLLPAILFSALVFCSAEQPPGFAVTQEPAVFQVSTIDALLAGVFDGAVSCGSLMQQGNLGIGTFDRLDGEMAIINGELFQVKADGTVYRPDSSITTPFATVCRFMPEKNIPLEPNIDFTDLQALLDLQAPNKNLFYAIRIKGTFSRMKTRSVPAQEKPYPPLAEVTAHQPEFEMENVTGTIVGFRCPPWVTGINVPGYHLHFISDDRTRGGHILAFTLKNGNGQLDAISEFHLKLPADNCDFAETDLSEDRSRELESVEQDSGDGGK